LSHKKETPPTNNSVAGATTSTSLKSLLAAGNSQQCTFHSDENGAQTDGTFYVADGKSRGDITSTANGKSSKTHMIYSDSTSYVWMDDATSGYKMSVDPATLQAKGNTDSSQKSMDYAKDYNYQCKPWPADASMFAAPTSVNFTEMSMPAAPNANASAGASMDHVCDALTGSAKTECENAMKAQKK
jgi:hypothetical protein